MLFDSGGRARLTGFRLAPRDARARGTPDERDGALHEAAYLPPEELRGGEAGVAGDLYQCGLVLYEVLTGRRAVAGRTVAEVHEAVLKKVPVPVNFHREGCPAGLVTLVQNLLRKRPAARYGSAAEVLADLADVRAGRDVPRRTGPAGA